MLAKSRRSGPESRVASLPFIDLRGIALLSYRLECLRDHRDHFSASHCILEVGRTFQQA
jgi:hypothetical protein